jgi:hypothetical protein
MGYLTQTWLAVSNDAAATVSGGYWYHRQQQAPAARARHPAFQDQLMDRLAALTGVALFQRPASSQIRAEPRPGAPGQRAPRCIRPDLPPVERRRADPDQRLIGQRHGIGHLGKRDVWGGRDRRERKRDSTLAIRNPPSPRPPRYALSAPTAR